MSTIEIQGLSRAFGSTVAVDRVSLTIADGDFLVLLGPSGCGKTTLLRMLAGLLEPTGGRILVDGQDVTAVPAKHRDLAMVFQSYALYPHLTVAKNLAFPLRVRHEPKDRIAARVAQVAQMLDIDHLTARRPKELSGGQRQRVAVGRALVRDPGAYLMDEPLSNLDAKLRTATRQELTALHRRLGATFVYVTHDQVEAMTMATRIVVMNDGRIEQTGSPEDVYDRPESVFVAGFLGSPATNLMPARVVTRDGHVAVEGDVAGLLWPGRTEPIDVTVGVRPEHLRVVVEPPTARGLVARGTVVVVENLGNEVILSVDLDDRRVAVRAPRRAAPREGEPVVLAAPVGAVHLFDRVSGRRLEWQSDLAVPPDLVADTESAFAG